MPRSSSKKSLSPALIGQNLPKAAKNRLGAVPQGAKTAFVSQSKKGKPYQPRIPISQQKAVIAETVAGKSQRRISREQNLSRPTVASIVKLHFNEESTADFTKQQLSNLAALHDDAIAATKAGLNEGTPYKRALVAFKLFDLVKISDWGPHPDHTRVVNTQAPVGADRSSQEECDDRMLEALTGALVLCGTNEPNRAVIANKAESEAPAKVRELKAADEQ